MRCAGSPSVGRAIAPGCQVVRALVQKVRLLEEEWLFRISVCVCVCETLASRYCIAVREQTEMGSPSFPCCEFESRDFRVSDAIVSLMSEHDQRSRKCGPVDAAMQKHPATCQDILSSHAQHRCPTYRGRAHRIANTPECLHHINTNTDDTLDVWVRRNGCTAAQEEQTQLASIKTASYPCTTRSKQVRRKRLRQEEGTIHPNEDALSPLKPVKFAWEVAHRHSVADFTTIPTEQRERGHLSVCLYEDANKNSETLDYEKADASAFAHYSTLAPSIRHRVSARYRHGERHQLDRAVHLSRGAGALAGRALGGLARAPHSDRQAHARDEEVFGMAGAVLGTNGARRGVAARVSCVCCASDRSRREL